jgi:iron complex outermembrane recepter protein
MTLKFNQKQPLTLSLIAQAALFLVAQTASAQTSQPANQATATDAAAPAAPATLRSITITAPAANTQADVTGFGDVPLQRTPISATIIGADQINAVGAKRLADVLKLDASTSDAYNAIGYWDYATMRGFVLDNKFNYRREGLPVSAETFIPLDNKERVELLKGTSGIQAGTSAPGGLINYAVKRPTAQPLRAIRLEAGSAGSISAAADLGGRFGNGDVFGYRLNLAAEKLNTPTPNTRGSRELAALAMDWRIGKDSLLEAEVEYSRRSQPSVPGLSLLGNTLPAANPRININNQAWSLPVELQGTTASLRFEQAINTDWRWSAQLGTQRLKSQDRVAFPFGCTDANGVDYFADRYCPNGDYDLFDFRSENERRTTNAVQAQLKGKFNTAGIDHQLSLGILRSSFTEIGQTGAYNYATPGTINLFAPVATAPDASLTDFHTNRNDKSLELSASDAIQWNSQFSTWIGLRHTQLSRSSERTKLSDPRPTRYDASVTTPWLAATYQLSPTHMLYASWGQGIESQVVPNKAAIYSNPGEALAPLKSSQTELGVKAALGSVTGSLAWFHIHRPMSNIDDCNNGKSNTLCLGAYDGSAVHSGLEANAQWAQGPWNLGGGLMLLNAKRQDNSVEPLANGQRPSNVPNVVARANVGYRFASVPGLAASGHLSHEGKRSVLPDASITLPAWTRVDAGMSYGHKLAGAQATWTLGIDNLLNQQFFKESPYQFGHVYLFPQQQRTARIGFSVAL